jgi:hypothetical protein
LAFLLVPKISADVAIMAIKALPMPFALLREAQGGVVNLPRGVHGPLTPSDKRGGPREPWLGSSLASYFAAVH